MMTKSTDVDTGKLSTLVTQELVQCGKGEALKGWQLVSDDKGMQFKLTCFKLPSSVSPVIALHGTSCQPTQTYGAYHITDYKMVKCPDASYMQGWFMSDSRCSKSMYAEVGSNRISPFLVMR